jgi:photosystem II stability/assembly factor-like uncharacterized protein
MLVLAWFLGVSISSSQEEWYDSPTYWQQTLHDVAAISRYEAVAVGDSGTVMYTTNGGETWEYWYEAPEEVRGAALRGVTTTNDGTIIVVGTKGVVMTSIERGEWSVVPANSEWAMLDVVCVDGNDLIASGMKESGAALIIRSTDKGATWTEVDHPDLGTAIVNKLYFTSASDGYALVTVSGAQDIEPGKILRTTDGGATWTEIYETGVPMSPRGITRALGGLVMAGIFFDQNEAGYYASFDDGATWSFTPQRDMEMITDVYSPDHSQAFFLGHRMIVGDTDVRLVAHSVRVPQAFVYHVGDIEDGYIGEIAVAGSHDRMYAVTGNGRALARWADPYFFEGAIVADVRQIDLGLTRIGVTRDTTVHGVLRSNSAIPLTIAEAYLLPSDGSIRMIDDLVGKEIPGFGTLDLRLRHEPRFEDTEITALYLIFNNGSDASIHISGSGFGLNEELAEIETIPTIDLGESNSAFATLQYVSSVITNSSAQALTITQFVIEGSDIGAFAIADLPRMPIQLQSGESLDLTIWFRPQARGVYYGTLHAETPIGTIKIPVSGRSRMRGFYDVVHFGRVAPGVRVERDIPFSLTQLLDPFDNIAVGRVDAPFAMERINYDIVLSDSVSVTISADTTVSGRHVGSMHFRYTWGNGIYSMRTERRILSTFVDATASVDDPVAASARVVPQPVREVASISIDADHVITAVKVQDLVGRTLIEQRADGTSSTAHINVQSLPAGSYVVVLTTPTRTVNVPLLKQ